MSRVPAKRACPSSIPSPEASSRPASWQPRVRGAGGGARRLADPARRAGTEHALYSQASYLFYVLAWGYLFRERVPNPDKPGSLLRRWRLTSWQWAAVGVLLVAVCLAQAREGVSVEVRDTARYPWWGVPLLIAQTLLLALSGAFTEVRGGGSWDEAGGPDESRPCFPARSTCTRSSYLWV